MSTISNNFIFVKRKTILKLLYRWKRRDLTKKDLYKIQKKLVKRRYAKRLPIAYKNYKANKKITYIKIPDTFIDYIGKESTSKASVIILACFCYRYIPKRGHARFKLNNVSLAFGLSVRSLIKGVNQVTSDKLLAKNKLHPNQVIAHGNSYSLAGKFL